MNSANPSSPIKTALIGVSGYAAVHLRVLLSLQEEGRIQLTAATVINREDEVETCEKLETMGCRIYGDYEEMLRAEAGNINLCCIPTAIAWHTPMTIAALKAGCHVLVEKPAAGTTAEVDAMMAAQKESGRLVFVGFQDLFLGTVQSVKKSLVHGEIGEIQSIRVSASWPRPPSYYERNNWAGRIRCGDQLVYDSPANNALAHYLIAALYFAGESPNQVAHAVSVEAELYRAMSIESFDTMCARIQTNTDILLTYSVSHRALESFDPILEIIGSKETLRWDVQQGFRYVNSGQKILCPNDDSTRREMFLNVLDSIVSGNNRGCSLEMARAHTQLIESLHQNCPITDVAPEYIHPHTQYDEASSHVKDMELWLRKSHESGKLFSDLGAPWAVKATKFSNSL